MCERTNKENQEWSSSSVHTRSIILVLLLRLLVLLLALPGYHVYVLFS